MFPCNLSSNAEGYICQISTMGGPFTMRPSHWNCNEMICQNKIFEQICHPKNLPPKPVFVSNLNNNMISLSDCGVLQFTSSGHPMSEQNGTAHRLRCFTELSVTTVQCI